MIGTDLIVCYCFQLYPTLECSEALPDAQSILLADTGRTFKLHPEIKLEFSFWEATALAIYI